MADAKSTSDPRLVLLTTNLARGGAETQVAQLAMHLRARGWDVHVVSLVPPTAFQEELEAAGVPVHAPGIAGLAACILELRPAIVHSHMFHANLAARVVQLVAPIPVVVSTLHSLKESSRRSESSRLRDLAYRLTDPWVDVTVAVSQAAAGRHADAKAVPRRKLRVIPNAVDTETFSPAAAPVSRPGVPFTWLAAGRLLWKKDYPTLLDAFVQLRNCELLIAGEGPDEAKLRAMAPPNVFFLGARDDLPNLLRRADAYVLSSRVEGLPVALLEAMASGLPCVATDAGGVRETGVPFLVAVRDPLALAAAMKQVLAASPEERRRLGAEARSRVLERFSWPVVISAWESLYRELLPWT
jgi:glycosyltransferase involved in cell wall biosynthesis